VSQRIDQARRAAKRRSLRMHRLMMLLQQMGAPPPAPSPSSGTGGGLAGTDVAALAAQLTALGFPPLGMYSVRFLQSGQPTTNALVGAITRWDDARGAVGFGPSLPALATPQLIGSGPTSYYVTTDPTSFSALQSAAFAAYDMATPLTFIAIRTLIHRASYNTYEPYVGLGGVTNVPYMGSLVGNGVSSAPLNLEAYFFQPGNENQTVTPPTILTFDGRVMLEAFTVNGVTAAQVVAPPNPAQAITLASAPAAGARTIQVGTDGSGTLFGATKVRALLVVPGVATAAVLRACVQWGVTYELALNDAPNFLAFDGDSLTFGFSLPDQSQCYPVQLMALSPYASGWAYSQTGTPSIALQAGGSPTLNGRAATIVDPAYNYAQTRTENICVLWAGTNDMALYAASGTTTFGYLQTYVNARRAVGWKVVIVTCINRGDIDINTERGVYNGLIAATYGGGAVPGVAVADPAANSHLGSNTAWMDTTYFLADKVHLTPVGYGLVAPLVSTAAQSIL
jgi:hypothetical protein